MKQEKRYLMMVIEIFQIHNLVTIATTKRDRTCQPTVVTTYFQFNIFCTSIFTIFELTKLLSHVQCKMLSSVPSAILSILDEHYSKRCYFKTNYYVIMISVLIHVVLEFVGFEFSLSYTGDNQHFEIFILSINTIEMRNIAFLCSLHFCFAFCKNM